MCEREREIRKTIKNYATRAAVLSEENSAGENSQIQPPSFRAVATYATFSYLFFLEKSLKFPPS